MKSGKDPEIRLLKDDDKIKEESWKWHKTAYNN